MSIVVDASFVASWLLSEPFGAKHSLPDLAAEEDLCAPALFEWEIENAMLSAERAQRITRAEADEALLALHALPIHLQETGRRYAASGALLFARAYGLTVYDAAYLALAADIGASLATADAALSRAARDLGIPLTR